MDEGWTDPTEGATSASNPADVGATRPFAPGDVVAGDLRIEEKIGQGGMGAVYRAKHLLLDRTVAIKVLHEARTPEDAYRIEREAKALARVRHENVVGVWDVRRSDHALIITMEYLPGGTLRDALRRTPSWRERLELCLQAGDGLAAAHAAGLVHRDFKPDNVLIDRDGRAVVGDFGLARAPGAVDATEPPSQSVPTPSDLDAALTATGAIMGTPAYMAPEQYEGARVDARADQFAFCVVLYEALYGRRPFPGRSPGEILYSLRTGALVMPPPDTDVPTEIWDLVRAGLARDPAARHPTLGRLLHGLRGVLRAPARRRLIRALALGSLLTAVVVGLSAWGGLTLFGYLDEARSWKAVRKGFDGLAPTVMAAHGARKAEIDEAARQAALEVLRTKPLDDPDVAGVLEALADGADDDPRKLGELIAAVAAGTLDARGEGVQRRDLPSADAPVTGPMSDEAPNPVWDGRSTLHCGLNERLVVRGKKADVAWGPAIEVETGCHLRLVDCDIEADIIVAGTMPAEVRIEGGRFRARKSLVRLTMPKLVALTDVTMLTKASEVAVDFLGSGGSARIDRCTISGDVGIETDMRTRIAITDSHVAGDTAAVRAGMYTVIDVEGTEFEGPIEKEMNAQIRAVGE